MRIGNNPNKDKKSRIKYYSHRVIVPIYIPNQEGYHKDSLRVLKRCITSLLNTITNDSAITIVNNGCCNEVVDYLNELFLESKIQDLIHTGKIGKLNSIIKAIKTTTEPLITITDADVLFLPGWLQNTVEVYNNFPKAGVVGIVPQFKQFENLGYNIIFESFFSNRVKFSKVINPEAIKLFYKSIGWENDYNKDYLKYILTIKSKKTPMIKAVIGSGHFVATYKRELFDKELKLSEYLLGGDSEKEILDLPCVKKGLWRLTTVNNYAYHMGNVHENWIDHLNGNDNDVFPEVNFNNFSRNIKPSKDKNIYFKISIKFTRIFYKKFKYIFYKKWGLPKESYLTY